MHTDPFAVHNCNGSGEILDYSEKRARPGQARPVSRTCPGCPACQQPAR